MGSEYLAVNEVRNGLAACGFKHASMSGVTCCC
jgi:hypothetical protein